MIAINNLSERGIIRPEDVPISSAAILTSQQLRGDSTSDRHQVTYAQMHLTIVASSNTQILYLAINLSDITHERKDGR